MSSARTSKVKGIGPNTWLKLIVYSDLSTTLKVVAHTLAFHADYTTGEDIYPGHDRLQDETSLGRTALKSTIAKLIALGLIERVSNGRSHGRGGGAQAAVYRLVDPGQTFHWHLNEGHKATIICGNQCQRAANEGHETNNKGHGVAPHPSSTLQVTIPPTPQPDRTVSRSTAERRKGEDEQILQDLRSQGLDLDEAQAVLEYARSEYARSGSFTKSVRGRLKQRAYLDHCRQAVKAARAMAFEARPKCLEHPTEVAVNCRACNSDVKCGDRDPRFIGQVQPRCTYPECYRPLIGRPLDSETCHGHVEAVPA